MANDQKNKCRTTTWFALVLVFVLLLFSVVAMKSGTVSPTHAAANMVTGTVSSSPGSGPAMAVIAVSGSGWQSTSAGTAVTFGYSTDPTCAFYTLVGDEQQGIMQGGVFSGWFRWPLGTSTRTPTAVPGVPQNTGGGNAADQLNILLITLASAMGLLLVAATFIGLIAWRRRTSLASQGVVPLPTPSPWNGGQPGISYGSMPGNAAPSPWPAAQGMPMSATLSPWQAATAMPQQNVPGMASNPLPLSVGAGAIVPAYGVVGSEVAMPAESADSSSSGLDPSLKAIMRQAQAGLFVLPGRRNA